MTVVYKNPGPIRKYFYYLSFTRPLLQLKTFRYLYKILSAFFYTDWVITTWNLRQTLGNLVCNHDMAVSPTWFPVQRVFHPCFELIPSSLYFGLVSSYIALNFRSRCLRLHECYTSYFLFRLSFFPSIIFLSWFMFTGSVSQTGGLNKWLITCQMLARPIKCCSIVSNVVKCYSNIPSVFQMFTIVEFDLLSLEVRNANNFNLDKYVRGYGKFNLSTWYYIDILKRYLCA